MSEGSLETYEVRLSAMSELVMFSCKSFVLRGSDFAPKSCASVSSATPAMVLLFYKLPNLRSNGILLDSGARAGGNQAKLPAAPERGDSPGFVEVAEA